MSRLTLHRTCEDMFRIDVRQLGRDGLLNGRGTITWSRRNRVTGIVSVHGDGDSITLSYAVDGEDYVERVILSKTPVNFGGQRAWFLCPGCSRRVAILYGGRLFRCRYCHDLRYVSQRESVQLRAISRIQRIRRKLGESGDLTQPVPRRPRHMHHKTYRRLLQEEADAWHPLRNVGKS